MLSTDKIKPLWKGYFGRPNYTINRQYCIVRTLHLTVQTEWWHSHSYQCTRTWLYCMYEYIRNLGQFALAEKQTMKAVMWSRIRILIRSYPKNNIGSEYSPKLKIIVKIITYPRRNELSMHCKFHTFKKTSDFVWIYFLFLTCFTISIRTSRDKDQVRF
jgi:hypothetical protein